MRILRIIPVVFVFIIALIAYPSYLFVNSYSNDDSITSPLPDFLTKKFPAFLATTNYWKPNINAKLLSINTGPNITARGAIAYDLTTEKLLYEHNAEVRMPMASITKIMTAIVALENNSLNHEYVVSKRAATIGENSMGISEGEIFTLEELLYGLVLLSGNDAAEVIAEGSEFGRENFIYLLNKKAEYMGLRNTRFTNPSGLEGDGAQYSTPFDLVTITKYALENPTFAKVAATVQKELPANGNHKYYYMFNETNLLTSYPGVKGVKTGYTFEAGLCLVTYLEHDGHKIIAVLLNAQNRRQEMKDLLDYSLLTLGVQPPEHE